jgi:hypothetical protein
MPGPAPDASAVDRAAWAIADALINPVSPDGTVYDLRFINIPVVAQHLARAGIGPVAGQAVIRAVDAPGGYRQWVDVDAADPAPVDLDSTPLSELDPNDPRVRELIAARFGTATNPPPPDGWRVRPSIKLDEECR